jgi:hypothetical protein
MQKFGLFRERVVRRIDKHFFHLVVGRRKMREFGLVKKEHVFIFAIEPENIFGQFVNIPADARKTRGVHSAVDADLH